MIRVQSVLAEHGHPFERLKARDKMSMTEISETKYYHEKILPFVKVSIL
jgi:hypothetical protein